MASKKPRINMVLDPDDYEKLRVLAEMNDKSLSDQARSLLLEMMEIREDMALAEMAAKRRSTFSRGKALSHEQMWGRPRESRRS
jgi:hypothetical protein